MPTPEKALPPEAKPGGWKKKLDAKKIALQTWQISRTVLVTLATYAYKTPYWTWYYATHAQERKDAITKLKEMAQHEAQHYWNGTKLLVADVRTARGLLLKTLNGNALTRREKKQLLRTVSDLFRLVPFSMFIIIPFMEFALPFALRIFPNLLPSTFQDSLKAEESMKRELQSRIAMAQFFQETLETLAAEQKKKAVKQRQELEQQNAQEHDADTPENPQADPNIYKQEDSAASMLEFLAKARNGEMIPPDVIIRYANYFQDDLTLDNMPRMQLINMCRYMNIPPYGSDSFLRFQLRHKIRSLKEDDQKILWEGIESLTKMELREAVQERGMRSTGLSKDAYKRALQQWLDLSVNKNVPIALLIMSRTFFLNEEIPPMPAAHKEDTAKKDAATTSQTYITPPDIKKNRVATDKKTGHTGAIKTDIAAGGGGAGTTSPEKANDTSDNSLTGLADAISGLDNQVLNEVILNMATTEEKTSDPEIRKLKLEVLQKQNELIRKEQQDYEDAKKQQQQMAAAKAAAAAEVLETSQAAAETSTEVAQGDESSTPSEGVEGTGDTTTRTPPSSNTPSPTAAPGDGHLTTEEMDALRTILTDDPVSSEREALEQIKAAMKGDMKPDQREQLQRIRESIESHVSDCTDGAKIETNLPPRATATAPMTPEEADTYVADQTRHQETIAASSTEHSTSWPSSDNKKPARPSTAQDKGRDDDIVPDGHGEEEPEDPIVARLKRRVESMVDKIELQLSETQVKIGDKMHLLDKDSDGILSREEVAEVLGQVFKKNITFEEAMEIANEMVRVLSKAGTMLEISPKLTFPRNAG